MPLTELGKHDGFDVTLADAGDRDGHRSPVTLRMLEGYDIIVGQRLSKHSGLQVWRGARTPTSRLVYETDDDVFTVNPENWQAFHLFAREDIRDAIIHGAEVADVITVTTPRLAEVMLEAAGNPNIVVVPNHIPAWVLDMPRARRERPSVGWQGGASHALDVAMISESVQRFLKRFPGWDLRLCGTDYRPTFNAGKGDTYFSRAVYSPWVRVNDDPQGFYESIDFDIGLAPVCDNVFNQSKSFVKALEYNARGIPVLASDSVPYRDYVKDGVNGFLIRYPHDWLKRMSELASDDRLREQMSASSREAAAAWTVESGWRLWADAYRNLFPS